MNHQRWEARWVRWLAMAAAVLAGTGCSGGQPVSVSAPPAIPTADSGAGIVVSDLYGTNLGPITDFVGRAQATLDCEIYEVTAQVAQEALGAAVRRGVKVRVIVDPHVDTGAALRARGVVVVAVPPGVALDHAKACVRDAGLGQEVLVGTANWSRAAAITDFDLVATLAGWVPAAAAVGSVIERDMAGERVDGSLGEAVVSPLNARRSMEAFLNTSGAKRVVVISEELRDAEFLGAMTDAAGRGAEFVVAAPPKEATPQGVERCQASRYVHAKVMLALGPNGEPLSMFIGSENISKQSLDQNRELGLILGAAAATQLREVLAGATTGCL